jgi:hypothetical protein
MFNIFRPTSIAKWIVLPWVQRHGWIFGIEEAYHSTSRLCQRHDFLGGVFHPLRSSID